VTAPVAAFVLTAGMVATATGGRLATGDASRPFETIATDSRTVVPGGLFIALVGARLDAHAFVDEAIGRGAAGVLVARMPAAPRQAAVILVDDTLVALQRLAQDVRQRSHARVIAITGSAGKTTTKEITADFLSSRYRVFRNPGNLNNHIGLPLSLLELRHGPELAVVELGMNHPGEIRTLVKIARPEVRVWTNVGDAHIGYFASRASIAQAKAEILEEGGPESLLVANADDPLVMVHAARFPGRRLTFGEGLGAQVRATHIVDAGFDGTTADVDTPAGRVHLRVPLAGRAQLSNVLAAAAVAVEFDVAAREIETRTAQLRAGARRGAMTTLENGARLVDDSYNASPSAMRAMLAALEMTRGATRRIAVLGEMLELGASSFDLHRDCGRAAALARVDELVVVGGPDADGVSAGAIEAGFDRRHLHRFVSSEPAAEAMTHLVRAGDLVLVKGSRGTRVDLVVDRLKGVA
jgi:UDP-N-acetylmuramoyl-tripeptide--D-alanyl-D-alanine ligase